MRPVEIVDYDPSWPILFAAERDGLLALLGDLVDAITISAARRCQGSRPSRRSTSMSFCARTTAFRDAVARVRATGAYDDHGDPYGDGRWTFTRGHGRGVRLYLCGPANKAHRERMRFRDWLRAHPEDAAAYEALKRRLAMEADGDFAFYTNGKSAFVSDILRKAPPAARRAYPLRPIRPRSCP